MAKKQPKITVIERDISDLIFAEYNPRQMTAAEKTNRKCYGMEIDPHYCDVIIKRWEDYTGKKAELYAVTEG
jgi:hypothetical protein